ncbi:hypothetical protein D3C80_2147260 [compost metagenome]
MGGFLLLLLLVLVVVVIISLVVTLKAKKPKAFDVNNAAFTANMDEIELRGI